MKRRAESLTYPAQSEHYVMASRHILHELETLLGKIQTFAHSRVSQFSMGDLEQPHDGMGGIDSIRRANAWDEICHNLIRRSLSDTLPSLVHALCFIFQIRSQQLTSSEEFLPVFEYEQRSIFSNHPITRPHLTQHSFYYKYVSISEIILKVQELYNRYVNVIFLRNAIRSRDPSCISSEADILFFLNHNTTFKQIHSEFERIVVRLLTNVQIFPRINDYLLDLERKIHLYKVQNVGKKDQQKRVLALEFLIREIKETQTSGNIKNRERYFLLLTEYVENIQSGKDYTFGVSLRTILSSKTCSLQKILCSSSEPTEITQ